MILTIDGRPRRHFYPNAGDRASLPAGEARHELLQSAGTLRAGVDGETPNVTPTLRNAAECARLFALPPIGANATLADDQVSMSGVVRSIAFDTDNDQCRLSIEP